MRAAARREELAAQVVGGFIAGLTVNGVRDIVRDRRVPGTLPGRLRVEYLRESRASWWSRALGVARRMGLGGGGPLVPSSAVSLTHGSLFAELAYIWQMYLPRLPGMHSDFPGIFTTKKIWFDGYIGLYGWIDTPFPGWVYDLSLVPAAMIAGLCAFGVAASTVRLRDRTSELITYGAMSAGLLALVGGDSYLRFPQIDAEYGQFRYMLPLLPLLGVVLALAARGAGRRWGPTVGVLIVMLFFGHDIFSQLQEVARFYG